MITLNGIHVHEYITNSFRILAVLTLMGFSALEEVCDWSDFMLHLPESWLRPCYSYHKYKD